MFWGESYWGSSFWGALDSTDDSPPILFGPYKLELGRSAFGVARRGQVCHLEWI